MGEIDLGPAFWALASLGTAAAIAYGTYFLRRPHTLLRAGVNTLFMAAFASALISADAPSPLVAAIVLSAAGDFFLAFNKKWLLPFGILSFLLAQLLYVVMFLAVWMFSGDNSPLLPRYIGMIAIGATLLCFLFWFWRTDLKRVPVTGTLTILALVALGFFIPLYIAMAALPNAVVAFFNALISSDFENAASGPQVGVLLVLLLSALMLAGVRRDLGAVRLAAMVYAGAITAMAIAAMWLPWIGWPASLGALLFLTSDFVLAAELFRLPADAPVRRITAPVVWWTYVAAQIGIVTGLVLIVRAGGV